MKGFEGQSITIEELAKAWEHWVWFKDIQQQVQNLQAEDKLNKTLAEAFKGTQDEKTFAEQSTDIITFSHKDS